MLPDLPQTEIAIVEMTNAFRRANALQTVKPNAALTAAARAFAGYLAKSGKFAHEADGREPAERAQAAGYSYCQIAENLAWNLNSRGFETRALARQVVDGWKESPSHRANLLQAAVTEIGVAVVAAPAKDPKFISVQLFGRPEALKVTFTIQNLAGKAAYYKLGGDSDRIAPRETLTLSECTPRQLSFDRGTEAPARFLPGNGDRFVIRAAGPSIAVAKESN